MNTPIDNTVNTPVDNTVNTPVDNTVTVPIEDVDPKSLKLNPINIDISNIDNKALNLCSTNDIAKIVADITSKTIADYINQINGYDFVIKKLAINHTQQEAYDCIKDMPLSSSYEVWCEVETQLKKNPDLYKKMSDTVSDEIAKNRHLPGYEHGASNIVFQLYKDFYSGTKTPSIKQTKTVSKDATTKSKDTKTTTKTKTTRSKKTDAKIESTTPTTNEPITSDTTTNDTPVNTQTTNTTDVGTQTSMFNMPKLW